MNSHQQEPTEYYLHPDITGLHDPAELKNLQPHGDSKGFERQTTAPATMRDKIALLGKVPEDVGVIFDFGTATGKLLRELRDHHKKTGDTRYSYVGYDLDPGLIEEARKDGDGIYFTDNLQEAMAYVDRASKASGKSVLVLSSIIHEIVHYQPAEVQQKFWNEVWKSGVDYVAIRDFDLRKDLTGQTTDPKLVERVRAKYADITFGPEHPLAGQNVLNVWENGFKSIPGHESKFLREGFKGWGSIDDLRSFTQFLIQFDLLGHDRTDPVSQIAGMRELQENIGSISFDELMKVVPSYFKPVFAVNYQDSYRRDKIEETFDIKGEDLPTYKMQVVFENTRKAASSSKAIH